jgi:hypothetical protein
VQRDCGGDRQQSVAPALDHFMPIVNHRGRIQILGRILGGEPCEPSVGSSPLEPHSDRDTRKYGFKSSPAVGLYLAAAKIKAALRESAHILNASGLTSQQLDLDVETLFRVQVRVIPSELYLNRLVPEGVVWLEGSRNDEDGNVIIFRNRFDYLERPSFEFSVQAPDTINEPVWSRVWTLAERAGLGAGRLLVDDVDPECKRGFGAFELTKWDVEDVPPQGRAPWPTEPPDRYRP